jgi:hypothetical protein
MRTSLGLLALGAVAAVALVSVLGAQETPSSPGMQPKPSASALWNFHFLGKKRRGDVVELIQLDDPKFSGKALVMTHLEMRMPQSIRLELTEYWQEPDKKQRDGKPAWARKPVRSDRFSAGVLDSTSEWLIANYDSNTGIVFDANTRPSLEVTFGSGDIEIWAEGYWATP